MRAVEMHYTAEEVATLLRMGARFIRERIKAGEFGADVFFVGREYIVPASAVNDYLAAHRVQSPGVMARTEGEYRRKVAA